MIVQLLGANGAGKSTIVTSLMDGQPRNHVHLWWDRRVPDGYVLPNFAVVGHYEGSACGGGDTLPRDRVLETLTGFSRFNVPILLEGPTGREPFLMGDVRVVYLRRSVEQNLDDWLQRNKTKGLSSNCATMLRRVRAATTRCDRMVTRYLEAGTSVTTTKSREAARECIRRLIGET